MERYKVSIKQIDWFDKENPEAEVLFEINGKQLWAFVIRAILRKEN